MGNLKLGDPSERLKQYVERFVAGCIWRIRTSDRSSFSKNSAPISPLRELAARENVRAKRVEISGVDANDYPRELGKGYGEFLMLDLGPQSKLAASHDYYAKLTGRLATVTGRIIRRLPSAIRHGCGRLARND